MNDEQNKDSPPSTDGNQQQEPQLNKPSTNKPTDPVTEKSDIINPTSEIQDMEVHHHTHAAHGKKNWKTYGWEFLMLFLAVFCGFLAEYQLENVIEHQREREYANALYTELSDDSTMAANNMRQRNKQEYQYFANPIKPFMLKYYDWSRLDELRKADTAANVLDVTNKYRHNNRDIKRIS